MRDGHLLSHEEMTWLLKQTYEEKPAAAEPGVDVDAKVTADDEEMRAAQAAAAAKAEEAARLAAEAAAKACACADSIAAIFASSTRL